MDFPEGYTGGHPKGLTCMGYSLLPPPVPVQCTFSPVVLDLQEYRKILCITQSYLICLLYRAYSPQAHILSAVKTDQDLNDKIRIRVVQRQLKQTRQFKHGIQHEVGTVFECNNIIKN